MHLRWNRFVRPWNLCLNTGPGFTMATTTTVIARIQQLLLKVGNQIWLWFRDSVWRWTWILFAWADSNLVKLAPLFGSQTNWCVKRLLSVYLALYALIGLLHLVSTVCPEKVAAFCQLTCFAIALFGIVGVFAVNRAWARNERRRLEIQQKIRPHEELGTLPELMLFSFYGILQLLVLFPLAFHYSYSLFDWYSAPLDTSLSLFDWFKYTLDYSFRPVIHVQKPFFDRLTDIEINEAHLGGNLLFVFKQYTFDLIFINTIFQVYQIHKMVDTTIKALETDHEMAALLGSRALSPLVKELSKSKSNKQRAQAAKALAHLDDKRAAEPLVESLKRDKDVSVRIAVAEALGRFRTIPVRDALDSARHNDTHPRVRDAASEAFINLGDIIEESQLLDELDSGNEQLRINAIRGLCGLGVCRHVERFIGNLNEDSQVAVRVAAAVALGRLGDNLAVTPLIEQLQNNPDARVREAAAKALGQLGDDRALCVLIDFPASQHLVASVRKAAAIAVGNLRNTSPGDPTEHRTSRGDSAPLRKPLLVTLKGVEKLNGEDWFASRAAATALGALRDPDAVGDLCNELLNDDPAIGDAAAAALGQIGDDQAVQPLVRALGEHKESAVRQSAAVALGHLGSDRALQPLRNAFEKRDEDREVHVAAIRAIAQLDNPAGLQHVIDALKDNRQNTRQTAAVALGKLGNAIAVEPLVKVLQDSHPAVTHAAILSLGQLGDPSVVDKIIACLENSSDISVQEAAVRALGELGEHSAVEAIVTELMHSKTASIREAAATSLGQLGNPRAVKPLIEAMKDPESSVVRAAVIALGELDDDQAVKPLLAAWEQDTQQEAIREAAGVAIGKLDPSLALASSIKKLKHEDLGVRESAAEVLGQMRNDDAVEPLLEALENGPGWGSWLQGIFDSSRKEAEQCFQEALVTSLGQLGNKRAVESLIEQLNSKHGPPVQKAAATSLGQIGDPQAVAPLLAVWEQDKQQEDIRDAAGVALATLDPKSALSKGIEKLEDEDPEVRLSAAEILCRIDDNQVEEHRLQEAVEQLLATLNDDNPFVCDAASRALSEISGLYARHPH